LYFEFLNFITLLITTTRNVCNNYECDIIKYSTSVGSFVSCNDKTPVSDMSLDRETARMTWQQDSLTVTTQCSNSL